MPRIIETDGNVRDQASPVRQWPVFFGPTEPPDRRQGMMWVDTDEEGPPVAEFYLEVAKGNIEGHRLSQIFGRNNDVDTGSTPEDVWTQGGLYIPPTTGRIHDVVSTSANDSAAGTGAQSVRLFGISGTGIQQTEDVTMNGTTPVPTVKGWTAINKTIVRESGVLAVNDGDISLTAQIDGTVSDHILAGLSFSMSAIFRVPSNERAFILSWYGGMNKTGGATDAVDVRLLGQVAPSQALITGHILGFLSSGNSLHQHSFVHAPIPVPAGTLLKAEVLRVTGNDTDVGAGFDLILIEDGF